jgi:hypothetical protein
MHLIWYNSLREFYEYGSSIEFEFLKKKSECKEALTILMEFTEDNETLANKIIGELNIANAKLMMTN